MNTPMREQVAARTMYGPIDTGRIEYVIQRLQDQRPGYKLEVMKLLDDVLREWKQLEAADVVVDGQ